MKLRRRSASLLLVPVVGAIGWAAFQRYWYYIPGIMLWPSLLEGPLVIDPLSVPDRPDDEYI